MNKSVDSHKHDSIESALSSHMPDPNRTAKRKFFTASKKFNLTPKRISNKFKMNVFNHVDLDFDVHNPDAPRGHWKFAKLGITDQFSWLNLNRPLLLPGK